MKIKSWTGNEVEARVGMVGDYQFKGVTKRGTITQIEKNWFVFVDVRGVEYVIGADFANSFTMLQCPFQVGDEVEALKIHFKCDDLDEWINITIRSHKQAERYNAKNKGIRHVNRDLRTSSEYKP